MLASLFNKYRLTNFIFVLCLMFIAFILARFPLQNETYSAANILKHAGVFSLLYLSGILLNIKFRNNFFTLKGNYYILIFALFLLTFINTTQNTNIIIANACVLLSLYYMVNVQANIKVSIYLFNAALLIVIASLFYFWAILFLVLLPIGLLLQSNTSFKHWLIPLIAIMLVVILGMCSSILVSKPSMFDFQLNPETSFNFEQYELTNYRIGLIVFFFFGLWSMWHYIKFNNNRKRSKRAPYLILLLALIIALLIIGIAPNKNGSELLFIAAPLAIIISNFFENFKKGWLKESLLLILIAVPCILIFL